jgi:hypothetical protein
VRVARGRVWVRRLLPALTIGWLLAAGVTAQAFTLVARTALTVAPASGQATTHFTVVGQYLLSSCPPPTQGLTLTFNFYWDKTPSRTPIWTKTVSTCTSIPGYEYYDSGRSPALLPPSGSAPGTHLLEVDVINASTGGQAPNGTKTINYTVLAPTPSPSPSPSPTPSPSPSPSPTAPPCYAEGHTLACPSPAGVDCSHLVAIATAPVPAGGMPFLLLGLVLGGGSAGLVLAPAIRRERWWQRVFATISLGLLALTVTQCVYTPPAQTQTSPTPAASVHTVVGFEATPTCRGYWMASSNGGIFPFGDATGFGSTGGILLNKPIVGMESTPDGGGYWLVAGDGGIFPFGNAVGFGSTGGTRLNRPIVAMENTPDGGGYWLVASDGGIFPFGDAVGYGSTGGTRLNQPIVDMEGTPDGRGYWLVAADGGIFPFGDATGYGSTGSIRLNKPIVGMEATPDGGGYWLVASDGGIFPFGDAIGYGSTGSTRLNKPIVGMEETPDGHGYWLIASDGGVFPFGDAQGYGSVGGVTI